MADISVSGILDADHLHMRKLLVSNVKVGTTEGELTAFFIEKVPDHVDEGSFEEVKIMPGKDGRPSMAFVVFYSAAVLDKFLSSYATIADADRKLSTNTINCRRAVPSELMRDDSRNFRCTSKKLFVANLPFTGVDNEEELRKIIDPLAADNPLGSIEKYQILKKKEDESQCRGFGFVHLTDQHLADKIAIQLATAKIQFGGKQVLDIKKNEDRQEGVGGGMRGGRGGRGGMPGGRGRGRGGFAGGYDPYAAQYGAAAGYGAFDQYDGGMYGGGYGGQMGYGQAAAQQAGGYGGSYY